METEYQHDRLLFTLVVDTITVSETVKAKHRSDRSRIDLVIRKEHISRNHSPSLRLKRMIQPRTRTFSSKSVTSSSRIMLEIIMSKTYRWMSEKMHALCERNFCLTLALTQPFLSMNVVNIAPNSRDESEAWRKTRFVKLESLNQETEWCWCWLSPYE